MNNLIDRISEIKAADVHVSFSTSTCQDRLFCTSTPSPYASFIRYTLQKKHLNQVQSELEQTLIQVHENLKTKPSHSLL
jgi:hypothetical protein